MKATHIMIELEKMVSDGNYGRERAVVQFAVDLDEGDDAQRATILLLNQARNRLNEQLGKSESLTVRRAIDPPPRVCNECSQPLTDDEDYEHEACGQIRVERRKREDDERRAKWEAERRQQRELVVAGRVDSDDDDDEPDDDDDSPL